MPAVPGRLKDRLISVFGSVGFAGLWLFYAYLAEPTEIGLVATAFATASLIALIQAHFKNESRSS